MAVAYTVFRGIKYAANADEYGKRTKVIDIADDASEEQRNKTGVTVLLEDFTEKFNKFHGKSYSNITAEDADENGWFAKKTDNVFATKDGQEVLKEAENYSQSDVFQDAANKYNGIKYGNKEDLACCALNFAKADIQAIEKSYAKAHPEDGEFAFFGNPLNNGALNGGEISSYANTPKTTFDEYINLDNDLYEVSAEEYASYILAVDRDLDGIVSQEEAFAIKEMDNFVLKDKAQKMYNKLYKE